jgi:hypothetical protein
MDFQKDNFERKLNLQDFDEQVEAFINEQRTSFDDFEPSLNVWANIDAALEEQRSKTPLVVIPRWYSSWAVRVAAAVILLLLGVGLGNWLTKSAALGGKFPLVAKNTEGGVKAEDVTKELQNAEEFYNQKVKVKLSQLASYNPSPEVVEDLKQIDEVQAELHRELENAPSSSREEIIERLMENYKIKLDILERVLSHLQQHSIETPTENQGKSSTKKQQLDTII